MRRLLFLLLLIATPTFVGLFRPMVSAGSQSTTAIKDFVGVNAVVNNNPSDLAQVAGWVRDYHKWYWYEPIDNDHRWSQPWQYLDLFYSSLKAEGVKVMPDVEMAPNWATSNGKADGIPNAAKHAEYLGALASHYGDTITAIENYNEPDKCCSNGKFTPESFGNMAALDFQAIGVANSSVIKVLAGLSNANTSYLDRVYQAGGNACDVINFHWYAVGDNTLGGVNPESGQLWEQIDEITAWRNTQAPGKPIWITEFGWDTYAQADGRKSIIYAPEASAANYLLRAIFLMQSRGIERAFTYIYRDPTDNHAYLHYLYHSSGLVTDKWEIDDRKKTGWYYLATLKKVLGDYVLDGIVANGPNIYHYEYQVPGTSQRAAVLWARDGVRDSGYSTTYRGPPGTLVKPVDGSTSGQSTPTDGFITVSEVPVFILYDGSAPRYADPVPTSTNMPSPDSGLLLNGGFENDLNNWYFPSWFSEVVIPSWSHLHSGNQALRLNGFSQGPYIRQDVALTAGQRVELSGWAEITRHESDKPLEVILVPLNQWGGEILTEPIIIASYRGITDGWVPFSKTIVTPDRTAKLRVQIQSEYLKGTAYFDELVLKIIEDIDTPTATPSDLTSTAVATPSVTATETPTRLPTETSTCTPTPTDTSSPTPTATVTTTSSATPTATETATVIAIATEPPTPTSTAQPISQEMLANGGFENSLVGWFVPSWLTKLIGVTSAVVRSETAALCFKGRATGPYAYQEVPASPGQRVGFSGWVYIAERNGNMSMVVEMIARDVFNRDKVFPIVSIANTTPGWIAVSGSAVMPEKTNKLRLQVRFPLLDGTAYLDDFSLQTASNTPSPVTPTATATIIASMIVTPTATTTATITSTPTATATPPPEPQATPTIPMPSEQERLYNPGFEEAISGWFIPSWLSKVITAVTDGCHSGSQCLRYQGRGSGVYVQQEVDASPGETLRVTGWINLAERRGSTTMVVELVARDSANREKVFTVATFPEVTPGWVLVDGAAVMPERTGKVRVVVRFPYLDGTAYIDDFSLRGRK